MLKMKYLGHSSILINDGRHQILIDPFLSGNPEAAMKPEDVHPDFIILTHAHGDHLGDSLKIAKANNSKIIAVNELAKYFASEGFESHAMHVGGSFKFPFGRVKLTIAHHSSTLDDGRYMGPAAGVLIKTDGHTVYHCGDTGLFMDMKLIGQLDDIDVMFVPIGDNFTMGIDDAVKAVEFVQPKLAVPIHFNTFPVIKADPQEFADKVKSLGKKAKVLKFGEELEL